MFDFFIDENGEVSKENIDIDSNRLRYQNLFCSLYSIKGDWSGSKHFGANIESFIGRVVNTDDNIEKELADSLLCETIDKKDIFIQKNNGSFDIEYTLYLKDVDKDVSYKELAIAFYGYV